MSREGQQFWRVMNQEQLSASEGLWSVDKIRSSGPFGSWNSEMCSILQSVRFRSVAHSGNPVMSTHFLSLLPPYPDLLSYSLIVLSGITSLMITKFFPRGLLFFLPNKNVHLILIFKKSTVSLFWRPTLEQGGMSLCSLPLWGAKTLGLLLCFHYRGCGLLWRLLLSFSLCLPWFEALSRSICTTEYMNEIHLLSYKKECLHWSQLFLMDCNTCFLLIILSLDVFFMTILNKYLCKWDFNIEIPWFTKPIISCPYFLSA